MQLSVSLLPIPPLLSRFLFRWGAGSWYINTEQATQHMQEDMVLLTQSKYYYIQRGAEQMMREFQISYNNTEIFIGYNKFLVISTTDHLRTTMKARCWDNGWVWSQVTSCAIHGEERGTGAGTSLTFLSSSLLITTPSLLHIHLSPLPEICDHSADQAAHYHNLSANWGLRFGPSEYVKLDLRFSWRWLWGTNVT